MKNDTDLLDKIQELETVLADTEIIYKDLMEEGILLREGNNHIGIPLQ